MKVIHTIQLVVSILVLFPTQSYAYVGPGAGLSAIGTIIAFMGAILLLVLGFIWYPIKRLMKRKKIESHRKTGNENTNSVSPVEETNKSP